MDQDHWTRTGSTLDRLNTGSEYTSVEEGDLGSTGGRGLGITAVGGYVEGGQGSEDQQSISLMVVSSALKPQLFSFPFGAVCGSGR